MSLFIFTQGRFSPLLPLSCIFLMLAGRYSGEAIKHKKHQKNKSEFSGSFKIISTSHLLETKIRGLKKKTTPNRCFEVVYHSEKAVLWKLKATGKNFLP